MGLQTVVRPGDEVIVFEPYFDLYLNQIRLAGGVPVPVPLKFVPYPDSPSSYSGSWELDLPALQSAITPKTAAVVLNSPHNPTGKVFTGEEMSSIASCIRPHERIKVLSDEVYKFIIHSPPTDTSFETSVPGHVHFASLPGMYSRTLTISSAGKTFSATGWQVGWMVGPSALVGPVQQMLPYVQFCANSVCQEALAGALRKAEEPYMGHVNYYAWLNSEYREKRDFLVKALQGAGFETPDYSRTAGGGFFIMAGITPSVEERVPKGRVGEVNESAPTGKVRLDWAICEHMVREEGVGMIPSSPFFSEGRVEEGRSDRFVRVAFCKRREVIEGAGRALMCQGGEEDDCDVEGL
ncbi:hypothetical protein TrRE_jg5327 [Triparma retinervis]|uniref:Aminotransferase class I/classII large domain-containing protein n=1 Tax=Triparma retinervis TaxID=2557542 RepID=A0A9W7DXW3_9STRA|nr:hypothetical protein TrRE_jg5327 [Triparma retinervis]